MTPDRTPPLPGSMTVPLLFGWQWILIAVTVVIVVTVAALLALAAGKGESGRSDWRAWLDGRSGVHRDEQDPARASHPVGSRPGMMGPRMR